MIWLIVRQREPSRHGGLREISPARNTSSSSCSVEIARSALYIKAAFLRSTIQKQNGINCVTRTSMLHVARVVSDKIRDTRRNNRSTDPARRGNRRNCNERVSSRRRFEKHHYLRYCSHVRSCIERGVFPATFSIAREAGVHTHTHCALLQPVLAFNRTIAVTLPNFRQSEFRCPLMILGPLPGHGDLRSRFSAARTGDRRDPVSTKTSVMTP